LAIRDEILHRADLKAGNCVLDVGAGRGLLAASARRQVGPTGRVVALDLSHRALHAGRARAIEMAVEPWAVVVGDARRLPCRGGTIDAVLLRAVLAYVADRALVVGELRRVLRPDGRVALAEPIFRHHRGLRQYEHWAETADLADFQPAHDRILAQLRQLPPPEDPLRVVARSFDERDLIRLFVDAGFREVALEYRYRYRAGRALDPTARAEQLVVAPDYAWAARVVLGDAAENYLHLLVGALSVVPFPDVSTQAYISAHR